MTLAFWLGRIGFIASGDCCAAAKRGTQIAMDRIAKLNKESRFMEIMVALLVIETWRALSNVAQLTASDLTTRPCPQRYILQFFTKTADLGSHTIVITMDGRCIFRLLRLETAGCFVSAATDTSHNS